MWKEQILDENAEGAVIPVNKWLARLTLDVIGESMSLNMENVSGTLTSFALLQLRSTSTSAHWTTPRMKSPKLMITFSQTLNFTLGFG